tara:strand:+ start:458 stop:712 length:255 start_codon:yes stop_codon:yes gene_type:complete
MKDVAEQTRVELSTVRDSCVRRLGIDGVADFDRLLWMAIKGNSKILKSICIQRVPTDEDRHEIDVFFRRKFARQRLSWLDVELD